MRRKPQFVSDQVEAFVEAYIAEWRNEVEAARQRKLDEEVGRKLREQKNAT